MSARSACLTAAVVLATAMGFARAQPAGAYEQALAQADAEDALQPVKQWLAQPRVDKQYREQIITALQHCIPAEGPGGLPGLSIVFLVGISGKVEKTFLNWPSPMGDCMSREFATFAFPPPQPVHLTFVERRAVPAVGV